MKAWKSALFIGLWSLAAAAEQGESLELEDAWVRAMPPTQHMTAAYLSLVNTGTTAIAVVGASADVASSVEIHTTARVDGLVRMEQLQGIALAADERVELVPGGMHLMLLGLRFMPVPGDEVRLCVQLASGDEVCTTAEVRRDE